jgi:hypothetical protein
MTAPIDHQELTARLARLEVQHEQIITLLSDASTRQRVWQESVSEALNGNGHPGIKTRLDRLEQAQVSRSKLLWAAISFAVTALCAALWDKLTGGRSQLP